MIFTWLRLYRERKREKRAALRVAYLKSLNAQKKRVEAEAELLRAALDFARQGTTGGKLLLAGLVVYLLYQTSKKTRKEAPTRSIM